MLEVKEFVFMINVLFLYLLDFYLFEVIELDFVYM